MKINKLLLLIVLVFTQVIFLYCFNFNSIKPLIGILLFTVQIIICIQLLLRINPKNSFLGTLFESTYFNKYLFFTLCIFGSVLFGTWCHNTIKKIPISIERSDIIPQVDTMCKRFLNDQYVYQKIQFKDYEMNPTYLPMQWLPYCIAISNGIDVRLFSISLFLIAILIVAYYSLVSPKANGVTNNFSIYALIFLLFGICACIIFRNIVCDTLEEFIAGIYMLIPLFIILRKYSIVSILICMCLLGRYSIVIWIPVYLFVLLLQNKKLALQQFTLILIGVLTVYIIPFLWQHPDVFLLGYKYHSSAALAEWKHYGINLLPYHLYDGQGLAFLFFRNFSITIESRLAMLQQVHIMICISFAIGCCIYYFRKKSSIVMELFLIASLLLYLILFYSFIQIPYKYLYIVPCSISITSVIAFCIYYNKIYNNSK